MVELGLDPFHLALVNCRVSTMKKTLDGICVNLSATICFLVVHGQRFLPHHPSRIADDGRRSLEQPADSFALSSRRPARRTRRESVSF
jgi:hypothetical protein